MFVSIFFLFVSFWVCLGFFFFWGGGGGEGELGVRIHLLLLMLISLTTSFKQLANDLGNIAAEYRRMALS